MINLNDSVQIKWNEVGPNLINQRNYLVHVIDVSTNNSTIFDGIHIKMDKKVNNKSGLNILHFRLLVFNAIKVAKKAFSLKQTDKLNDLSTISLLKQSIRK